MILTDTFVMINVPRTGSTFIRTVLRHLHKPWSSRGYCELSLPIDRTWKAERLKRRSQHGRLGQIPLSHRHLPVVSVIRHPLDHAVSHYNHKDWWSAPPVDEAMLRSQFPTWPKLSFAEYLDFEHEICLPDVLKDSQTPAEVGNLTVHFLRFFARDPNATLAELTDARIDTGAFASDLPPIHWLRHHRLIDDLSEFLQTMGYPSRQIDRVRRHRPVNVSQQRGDRHWRTFYNHEQEELKRFRERALFKLFPEFAD